MKKKSGEKQSQETSVEYYDTMCGDSSEYADVRKMISQNRLDDAQQILDGVDTLCHSKEWNYLKAIILVKKGFRKESYFYASKAYNEDPDNNEYSTLYNNLNECKSSKKYITGILGGLGCVSFIFLSLFRKK